MSRLRMLQDGTDKIGERIDWRDAFQPFVSDWRYSVWAMLALGLGVPLASVGNFLPQIVARLGYDTIKTNLYTVAPVRLSTGVASAVGSQSLICRTSSVPSFSSALPSHPTISANAPCTSSSRCSSP